MVDAVFNGPFRSEPLRTRDLFGRPEVGKLFELGAIGCQSVGQDCGLLVCGSATSESVGKLGRVEAIEDSVSDQFFEGLGGDGYASTAAVIGSGQARITAGLQARRGEQCSIAEAATEHAGEQVALRRTAWGELHLGHACEHTVAVAG